MYDAVRQIVWKALSKLHYYLAGSYTHQVAVNTWDLFTQLWFYLVLGVLITALISLFWQPRQIASFLQKSPRSSIVTATLVGVVSPVPTYVAIPLVAALYRAGVPIAPLFAFLVASPLMNPVLFSLTAGAFGYEMAITRAASALALGVTAGLVAQFLAARNHLERFICADSSEVEPQHGGASARRTFRSGAAEFSRHVYRQTRWMAKYFLLGIVIAGAVKALIPADWIIRTLGNQSSVSVLVAVAAGVPLYACGGGTIPVMQALQQLGMDKGAILAFFISGPATKLSTLAALKAVVRAEAFLVYLGIGFLGACVCGLAYSIW